MTRSRLSPGDIGFGFDSEVGFFAEKALSNASFGIDQQIQPPFNSRLSLQNRH